MITENTRGRVQIHPLSISLAASSELLQLSCLLLADSFTPLKVTPQNSPSVQFYFYIPQTPSRNVGMTFTLPGGQRLGHLTSQASYVSKTLGIYSCILGGNSVVKKVAWASGRGWSPLQALEKRRTGLDPRMGGRKEHPVCCRVLPPQRDETQAAHLSCLLTQSHSVLGI